MTYLKVKANKILKVIIEWELERFLLKYLIKNLYFPIWVRQFALLSLTKLPLQSSFSYLHNRCYFSNQPRSILTFFKLNRVRFKMLLVRADLTGVKKKSW